MLLRSLVLIIAFLFSAVTQAQFIPNNVKYTLAHFDAKDYDAMLKVFAFDATYTKEDEIRDKTAVKAALEMLVEEFGDIEVLGPNEVGATYYRVTVGSGTTDFMKAHPNYTQYLFDANFSNYGKGYVFVNILPEYPFRNVKSVGFGLPDDSFIARDVMKRLGTQIIQLWAPDEALPDGFTNNAF